MKTLVILTALSLTSLVYAAQDNVPSVPVPAADQKIELPANARKMWPDEFSHYLRTYTLSNGQSIALYTRGTSVYATLDDGDAHKMMAVNRNTFVAQDRKLKMNVTLDDSDEASGYALIAVPAQRMADGTLLPEHLQQFAMR